MWFFNGYFLASRSWPYSLEQKQTKKVEDVERVTNNKRRCDMMT